MMKEYTTDKIRNVALVGHQGSGKTSLAEALLHITGATTRLGRVEDKNTVSDWDDDEKARGMSINTSLIAIEFNDHKINLLDTPGFGDFVGDTKSAVRVSDAVVVAVDAVSGVEVGTEAVWEYARDYQQPIIVTITKMDRENANFERTLNQLREAFPKYKFVPVMIPIGAEANFKGVVNLVTQKAYFNEGKERSDLPADMVAPAEEARVALIEAAAEADDELMQKYFDEGALSTEEIREGMRKASRSHLLLTVPVFVTSGTHNIGTYPLLEALLVYVSPPSQRRVRVMREGMNEFDYLKAPQSDENPLAGYVFKTASDKYGTLSYIRVFSGKITPNSRNKNVSTGEEERFSTLNSMRGREQLEMPILHAGDIGVVAKLNNTHTGDTLADKDQTFRLVKPEFSAPLYMVAVTPKTQADSAKIGAIFSVLCQNDPTLRWRQDKDTGQTLLEGMGEIHVATAIKKAEGLGLGVEIHLPRIPYRETISQKAEATYRHKKQSGGAGQFGEVTLRVEPCDEEFVYETQIVGGAISGQFLPSVEKGIRQVLEEGIVSGYPVVQTKVVVFDGKEHPVDSKDIAFQVAGREAFKEAFHKAKPALLEPIVDVVITVPEAMMGDILGDLTARRGRVQGMDTEGRKSIINAQVPLAEMLRYGNDLRSMSGGRGVYTMTFAHYERVPSHLQDAIIAQHKPKEHNT